jgi:hypothetical protein
MHGLRLPSPFCLHFLGEAAHVRYARLQFCNARPEIRNARPEIRNARPEIRNARPVPKFVMLVMPVGTER